MKKYYLGIIGLYLILNLASCAKPQNNSEKIAVTINDYKMSLKEFDDLYNAVKLKTDTSQTRQAFLENIITRKLILQEAQQRGLDKEEDFLKMIERFWEQTLLQLMIEYKTQDIQKQIDDTQDINKKRLLAERQNKILDAWIKELNKNARISINIE